MTSALPIAQTLLECLRAELSERPAPLPDERVCLRAGEVFNPDRSRLEDECCPGIAWVRVVSSTMSSEFDMGSNCVNHMRDTLFELGVTRCMPTPGPDDMISCDTWTDLVEQMESDHSAMEEAICCFNSAELAGDPQVRNTEYTPVGPDANCIGATLTVTITHGCACGSA